MSHMHQQHLHCYYFLSWLEWPSLPALSMNIAGLAISYDCYILQVMLVVQWLKLMPTILPPTHGAPCPPCPLPTAPVLSYNSRTNCMWLEDFPWAAQAPRWSPSPTKRPQIEVKFMIFRCSGKSWLIDVSDELSPHYKHKEYWRFKWIKLRTISPQLQPNSQIEWSQRLGKLMKWGWL